MKRHRESSNFSKGKNIAMARGTLVLDDGFDEIAKFLQNRNIRVIRAQGRLEDATMKTVLLANRILVTKDEKDFMLDAPALDCGIISTKNIEFGGEKLARRISDALTELSLWPKRHGFLVTLNETGAHDYRELTE